MAFSLFLCRKSKHYPVLNLFRDERKTGNTYVLPIQFQPCIPISLHALHLLGIESTSLKKTLDGGSFITSFNLLG